MRVVAYVRVSTTAQVEDGLGLDVQEQAVRGWAERNGHAVVHVARDEGVSGTLAVDQRPGLTDALSLLEQGEADGLVVAKLDRLARLLTVQEATLALAWKHDAKVFAADTGEVMQDDPEDPMRTAMRQVMGVFAQLERATIAARLRAGRRLKAERGGFAYGAPAFGFSAVNRELAPDPVEQAAVERIAELRAEGASLRAIADTLRSEGHRPRRSGTWQVSTLARIVQRLTP